MHLLGVSKIKKRYLNLKLVTKAQINDKRIKLFLNYVDPFRDSHGEVIYYVYISY